MAHPTISVINFGTNLEDREAQSAIRAVNRQITEDFAPAWGSIWELTLHASGANSDNPNALEEEPVRGEGVLYLIDEATLPTALGFHAINTSERPFGFVFVEAAPDWSVTLSHEALEMMIDPTVNVMVPGPDPRDPAGGNVVLHSYEVCDAVERTSYEIDGFRVSNFITPSWFFPGDAPGTRNDFLGVGVPSFGATTGSHLSFFDLGANRWETVFGENVAERARASEKNPRFAQYAYDRRRKNDEEIDARLREYQDHPPKCVALAEAKAGGLPNLKGVSRSSRKRAEAERLFTSSKK